jgi:hypothetical protein
MTLPFPSALDAPLSADEPDVAFGPSGRSSYVVAEVEYEPWADELRLCGGDETLIKPSDVLTPAVTDFPSPLPFSRLGVPPRWPKVDDVDAFDFRVELLFGSVPRGLGGTLLDRLGGWGKELMLTALRIVLPAALTAETARG